MIRVIQHSVGGPDVLEVETDAPRPAPAPGEVLVETRAIGVNPIDTKVRAGNGLFGDPPFTVGFDLAGVVVEGEGFAPGTEVMGMIRFPEEGACYAEYVAAPADQLIEKPELMPFEQAAALPLASLTAWQALVDNARIGPGERVLIHAGAGGVGHLAIQIAKSRGAHVITTASEPKLDFVRALGADQAIDYRATDFVTELGKTVDVVFDTVGGGMAGRSLGVIRPGGRLVTIVDYRDDSLPGLASAAEVEYHGMRVTPSAGDLQQITDLYTSGSLHIELAAVLALENADKAHELIETHSTTGKIVLVP